MRPHTLQYHHIERSLTCLHREYYRLCRLNQRLYLYLRCQYQLLPLSLTCLINDYYICVNIPFTNIPVTILLIFFVHPIQNARGLRAQGSELALCSVLCALCIKRLFRYIFITHFSCPDGFIKINPERYPCLHKNIPSCCKLNIFSILTAIGNNNCRELSLI